MKAYAVLITQNNSLNDLMNNLFVHLIKKHNGGFVLSGFDQTRFLACICFAYESERDGFAAELDGVGIEYIKRNDAIIPDGYI